MMRFFTGWLYLVFAGFVTAQGKDQSVLKILSISPIRASVGKTAKLIVPLEVRVGFHVQSNPASARNLIPTTVSVDVSEGIAWEKPVYPPGKPYRLEGAAKDILTYEGKFEVSVPFRILATAKKGTRIISGMVRYQACDDKTCFFPKSVPFKARLEVF